MAPISWWLMRPRLKRMKQSKYLGYFSCSIPKQDDPQNGCQPIGKAKRAGNPELSRGQGLPGSDWTRLGNPSQVCDFQWHLHKITVLGVQVCLASWRQVLFKLFFEKFQILMLPCLNVETTNCNQSVSASGFLKRLILTFNDVGITARTRKLSRSQWGSFRIFKQE